jgi:hypothetical protein
MPYIGKVKYAINTPVLVAHDSKQNSVSIYVFGVPIVIA